MSTKRERIRAKTHGHCAYCGCKLPDKGWHMDHVEPLWRDRPERGGDDSEANLVPACPRCNRWKKVLSPEQFRIEIGAQFARLYRDSAGFRLAVDFGLIRHSGQPVEFYMDSAGASATTAHPGIEIRAEQHTKKPM